MTGPFTEGERVKVWVQQSFYREATFVRETKHGLRYYGARRAYVQFQGNKGPSQVFLTCIKRTEVD